VLQVSKNGEGEIEIALLSESVPAGTRSLIVIHTEDVPTLIDMLRQQVGDPEDLSTMRNLRPIAKP
jgi:hypothetical protein